MKIYDRGMYREMTAEENAAHRRAAVMARLEARDRPLTEGEVSRMLMALQINRLPVDDNTALRMAAFYPAWAEGAAYGTGDKVQHEGCLWRCLQAHTAQSGWAPVAAASLWTQVLARYAGTAEDPVPYTGNAMLEAEVHYAQSGVIYRCIRSTEAPVHHALADLVGIYVEEC